MPRTLEILVTIKYALVALGAAISALGLALYYGLMSETRLADARLEEVARTQAALHAEIGYGGLIHNFDRYVLRGGANYRFAAIRNHEQALELLDHLAALLTDEEAAREIGTVRATLSAYRDNLEVAAAARERGRSAEEIDLLVAVDDTNAVHLLTSRIASTSDALREQRERLALEQRGVFTAVAICVTACFVLLSLVIRQAARSLTFTVAEAGPA